LIYTLLPKASREPSFVFRRLPSERAGIEPAGAEEARAGTLAYRNEYTYYPTGELTLTIFNTGYGVQTNWSDGKRKTEERLGSFITGIIKIMIRAVDAMNQGFPDSILRKP
jgi:hypothetical protein